MKWILLLLGTILVCSCVKEKKYCGVIIDKGYDPPSAGYESSIEHCYWIILRVDSINTAIRVNVPVSTFYKLEKSSRACFNLSEDNLRIYGDGSEHLIK